MSYSRALALTIIGVSLMSFESLLIRLTALPAQNVTFYFGLLMFASTQLILLFRIKEKLFKLYKDSFRAIFLSAIFMGMSNLFFVLAIKNTSVASAVFILSTAPLISALIGFVLFKTRSPKRLFIATFFVFIGLGFILYHDWGKGNMEGNLYAFFCVLSFSSLFAVLERYKEVSRLACIGFGGLTAALLAFFTSPFIVPDAYSFAVIFFMGALLTPASRLLIGLGTKVLPSTDIALLTIIETLLAPVWVWIFLGEVMMPPTLIGGGIIVITLIIYTKMANKAHKQITYL